MACLPLSARPFPFPGVDYNSFFLAGVLGMASFGIASNSSWSFFMDRDNGIFYEMLTYPMSRSEYLLGKVAFNLFIALAQAAITLLLGSWLLDIHLRYDLFPILFVAIIVGTSGWFFFYTIFASAHSPQRHLQRSYFRPLLRFPAGQLALLSDRSAPAGFPHRRPRQSHHLGSRPAPLRHHRFR